MKVVVITCEAYRDAWLPFSKLFDRFWPDCPFELAWWSDEGKNKNWAAVLHEHTMREIEPFLLMQEDFFLSAPVRTDLVQAGLDEMFRMQAGGVRLYPCPGADEDYGHPYFGYVSRRASYRISCQATIWNPRYVAKIAQTVRTPSEFEIAGTIRSLNLVAPILAFKREVEPWPMHYLCSAISRGKWNPDAQRLCQRYGIEVDWTQRPVA